MRKASLTVLYSMLIPIVMSLMFTMTECVRVYAMEDNTKIVAQQATESGFSNYINYLWENYHILGVDYTHGQGEDMNGFELLVAGYANKNVNPFNEIFHTACVNLTMMNAQKAEIVKYGLLTDGSGAAVIAQGKTYAIEYLGFEALELLKSAAMMLEKGETNEVGALVDNAKSEAANAASANAQGPGGAYVEIPTRPSEIPADFENPLDAFDAISQAISGGLLKLVLPDGIVSNAAVESAKLPSGRSINSGNVSPPSVGVDDKLWYILYLLDQYSRYDDQKDRDGLLYETEYVLCGKNSDKENLADVAARLLAIREGCNAASLAADPSLMAIVHTLAGFLAALLAAPYLEPVFAVAIVGIWALVESILDLRRIMSGGTVYLMKTAATWSSDIFHISKVLNNGVMSLEAYNGVNYGVYLATMLSVEGIEKIGMRSCDVLQQSLNKKDKYASLKLDTLMYQADIDYSFAGSPLFMSWVIIPGGLTEYGFKATSHINYLKDE